MTTATPTELARLKSRLKGRLTAIGHDRTYVEITKAKLDTSPKVETIAAALDRVEAVTTAMLTALAALEPGRRFIGADLDAGAIATARARLDEAQQNGGDAGAA
jgi:hypothetical protein